MMFRLIAAAMTLSLSAAFAADPGAPPTRVAPVTDTVQGVQIADPYRWLENGQSADVETWSDAQTARARKVLDAVPGRAGMKTKLTALITAASSSYADLQATTTRLFAIYSDPAKQQPMLITKDLPGAPSRVQCMGKNCDPDIVVLDPNVIDAKGGTAIDWYVASADGSKVAVSLSQNGSEDGTLHVYDVATAKEIDTPIPAVQYPTAGGSAAWNADGSGFWYTRFPGPERPEADRHFFQQVYYHRLGHPAAEDVLVLGEKDGLPRVAEVQLDNRYSRDSVLASVQLGDGGKFAHWILKPDGSKIKVSGFDDGVVAAAIGPDDALYMISRADAAKGKVLKAPLGSPTLAKSAVIVPEGTDALVTSAWSHALTITKDRLIVPTIVGGPSKIAIFDHAGKAQGAVPLPDVSAVDEVEALPSGDVLYGVSTYLRPHYYALWHAATGASDETKMRVTSPVTFDDTEVVRAFAVSKDGTRVPMTIIRRKGMALNGQNPTVLYGYGGYGINETPHFLGARWRLWLDAGGVYVETNLRGGGEYGEAWHRAGNLLNKQNVFDDFTACAQYLIARKITRQDKLALMGGSNGGLLMGAMITQHPDIAHAVVSQVGIYDMLRVELDPNGMFNTTEFGTVKDLAQFKALYAYSPYHHVTAGTKYPAVLLMTGANDGRVNPMHSRKFAAALQAATTSGQPILLRVSKTSGHGQGSALAERIDGYADILAFLYGKLGLTWGGG